MDKSKLSEEGTNVQSIVCKNCKSLILKAETGKYSTKKFELPLIGSPTEYWAVSEVFAFENIAVSKSVDKLVYLACADCDMAVGAIADSEHLISCLHVDYL